MGKFGFPVNVNRQDFSQSDKTRLFVELRQLNSKHSYLGNNNQCPTELSSPRGEY